MKRALPSIDMGPLMPLLPFSLSTIAPSLSTICLFRGLGLRLKRPSVAPARTVTVLLGSPSWTVVVCTENVPC